MLVKSNLSGDFMLLNPYLIRDLKKRGLWTPDIQNKLFPIIHERKVQGLPLEGLRYRWAAMNPPLTDEKSPTYIGTEPLDVALADRFAFVVTMPDWSALSEAQQIAVIRATAALLHRERIIFGR